MKKQKIQMLVVVILLVICVVAYIFISKNAGKLDSTENDGPNASMGNVTESVLEMLKESGYPGMKVLEFSGNRDRICSDYRNNRKIIISCA